MNIGNFNFDSRLILAPLSGLSDLPYRLLNRKFGCKLAFTEMISAKALTNRVPKTLQMLKSEPSDNPLAVQLFGLEHDAIAHSVEILNKHDFAFIDFNAACPVKKVTARGEGAALLKNPAKLDKILKLMVKESRFPITIKIRIGWDDSSINALEIAKISQDAGVKAVFIHGRTRNQGYRAGIRHDVITSVKKALSIPVIASGNIFSPILAKEMFEKTCCDAVLIARGSMGNPWIFGQIEEFLKTGSYPERPNCDEIASVLREHFLLLSKYYPKKSPIIFRKFFIWYTKGIPFARELRVKASKLVDYSQVSGIIDEFSLRDKEKLSPCLIMNKWLNLTIIALPLVILSCIFGFTCLNLENSLGLSITFSYESLSPVLMIILFALLLMAFLGALALAVKEKVLAIGALFLSSLGLFVSWGISPIKGVITLIYLFVCLLFYFNVQKTVRERIKFSVFSISDKFAVIALILVIVISSSVYFGLKRGIKENGFKVPAAYLEFIVMGAKKAILIQLPQQPDPSTMYKLENELRAQVSKLTNEFIGKHERFVPIIAALSSFGLLSLVIRILTFLPLLLLAGIISLFFTLNLLKITKETVEAERISVS